MINLERVIFFGENDRSSVCWLLLVVVVNLVLSKKVTDRVLGNLTVRVPACVCV